MATITLTITKDGTEADPNSGDHATVVFDDERAWEASTFLDWMSRRMRAFGWQRAFEFSKFVERNQDLAAESGQ